MRGGGNKKRYLITVNDDTGMFDEERTNLADSKPSALDLLSSISSSNDQRLISVIEVDVYTAQTVKLELFLNENFKFDLREKQ